MLLLLSAKTISDMNHGCNGVTAALEEAGMRRSCNLAGKKDTERNARRRGLVWSQVYAQLDAQLD